MQTKNNWFDIVKFEKGKFAKDLFNKNGTVFIKIRRVIFKEVWMGEKIPTKFRAEMLREAGMRKYTLEESQVINKFAISGSKPFISYTVPSDIKRIIKKHYEEDKHQFRMYGVHREMEVGIDGHLWWDKKRGVNRKFVNQVDPNEFLQYYTNRIIILSPLFRLRFKNILFEEFIKVYDFIKNTFTISDATLSQRIDDSRLHKYFTDYQLDIKNVTNEEIQELFTTYKGEKTYYKGYGFGGNDAPAA